MTRDGFEKLVNAVAPPPRRHSPDLGNGTCHRCGAQAISRGDEWQYANAECQSPNRLALLAAWDEQSQALAEARQERDAQIARANRLQERLLTDEVKEEHAARLAAEARAAEAEEALRWALGRMDTFGITSAAIEHAQHYAMWERALRSASTGRGDGDEGN